MRATIDKLFAERERLFEEIVLFQNKCDHKVSVYSAHGSSGHWDNDSYYWYQFYCYDCRKCWSVDQDEGHGSSFKVEAINYDENPEVIELMIKIKEIKN